MNIQHKELAAGRWHKLTLAEQLANVGSEVERAINWRGKRNAEYGQLAFERALELLDLTVSINKNFARLKELLRLREALADYFAFDNVYRSTDGSWRKYFFAFNYAARGHS
ncbi:hypothetical protein A2625_05705 [candidate division WOR-1 bacterium RIFCSPHIGHO2_01_FULL_53_15]|uniref:Uncharacterized protein n=1 Tax=candidate division WOR-1 bacterium RIFCSPHIGHO2_01_FULL_53_15 TaxID=1802564 RepID=A0A1F4Q3B9_UNCSA|nr:MAG: hypothetical protein A2625_05705 [candidate division WOR-1 bacterium RIFCSPHIGHO2_01_FULL_53_15]OGC10527.1 MAG: hypothetical protein A3D23_04245 [candidate division WOR-1 bacterium RIFCSPHIGHO2_02_FULL_53_26]